MIRMLLHVLPPTNLLMLCERYRELVQQAHVKQQGLSDLLFMKLSDPEAHFTLAAAIFGTWQIQGITALSELLHPHNLQRLLADPIGSSFRYHNLSLLDIVASFAPSHCNLELLLSWIHPTSHTLFLALAGYTYQCQNTLHDASSYAAGIELLFRQFAAEVGPLSKCRYEFKGQVCDLWTWYQSLLQPCPAPNHHPDIFIILVRYCKLIHQTTFLPYLLHALQTFDQRRLTSLFAACESRQLQLDGCWVLPLLRSARWDSFSSAYQRALVPRSFRQDGQLTNYLFAALEEGYPDAIISKLADLPEQIALRRQGQTVLQLAIIKQRWHVIPYILRAFLQDTQLTAEEIEDCLIVAYRIADNTIINTIERILADHVTRLPKLSKLFTINLSVDCLLSAAANRHFSFKKLPERFTKDFTLSYCLTARNQAGESALHIAIRSGQLREVRWLCGYRGSKQTAMKCCLSWKTANEDTVLHIAARYNRMDLLGFLYRECKKHHLPGGTSPFWQNKMGKSPLHCATSFPAIESLIAYGFDPNQVDKNHYPPILYWVRAGIAIGYNPRLQTLPLLAKAVDNKLLLENARQAVIIFPDHLTPLLMQHIRVLPPMTLIQLIAGLPQYRYPPKSLRDFITALFARLYLVPGEINFLYQHKTLLLHALSKKNHQLFVFIIRCYCSLQKINLDNFAEALADKLSLQLAPQHPEWPIVTKYTFGYCLKEANKEHLASLAASWEEVRLRYGLDDPLQQQLRGMLDHALHNEPLLEAAQQIGSAAQESHDLPAKPSPEIRLTATNQVITAAKLIQQLTQYAQRNSPFIYRKAKMLQGIQDTIEQLSLLEKLAFLENLQQDNTVMSKCLRQERGFFRLLGRYGNTRSWETANELVKQSVLNSIRQQPRLLIDYLTSGNNATARPRFTFHQLCLMLNASHRRYRFFTKSPADELQHLIAIHNHALVDPIRPASPIR